MADGFAFGYPVERNLVISFLGGCGSGIIGGALVVCGLDTDRPGAAVMRAGTSESARTPFMKVPQ